MPRFTLVSLLAALTLAAGAEEFQSAGFTATISENGVVTDLKYAGTPLIRRFFLHGNNMLSEGEKKVDGRLFQTADSSKTTVFKRDGQSLLVAKKAVMRSLRDDNRDFIDYTESLLFTPEKITCRYEVTTKNVFYHQTTPFCVISELPLSLAGRGLLFTGKDGVEATRVLPKEYTPDFKAFTASSLAISIPAGIFRLKGMDGISLYFSDTRSWKGDHYRIDLSPAASWTQAKKTFPEGSQFTIEFELTFEKEN